MFKQVEKQILDFVDTLPEVKRREVVHGTLYVTLEDPKDCDVIHYTIRDFYRKKINSEGGVNMYALSEEFAFDFVPEDREAPVFNDEVYSGKEDMMPSDIDKGVWSEFAEEGLAGDFGLDPDNFTDEQLSDIDVQMQLEAESKRGK